MPVPAQAYGLDSSKNLPILNDSPEPVETLRQTKSGLQTTDSYLRIKDIRLIQLLRMSASHRCNKMSSPSSPYDLCYAYRYDPQKLAICSLESLVAAEIGRAHV